MITTLYLSCVTCHVSYATCHVSCYMLHVTCKLYKNSSYFKRYVKCESWSVVGLSSTELPRLVLLSYKLINRPSVARDFLWTPLSLIDWLIKSSFHSESSRHCLSQTLRAGELNFWENDHPPPCVMCQVSHFMCHVSHVSITCQLSCVSCHMSLLFLSKWLS